MQFSTAHVIDAEDLEVDVSNEAIVLDLNGNKQYFSHESWAELLKRIAKAQKAVRTK